MSAPSSSIQSLQARLKKVQTNLQLQENKLQASRRSTLIVGVLSVILAGSYFLYGYRQFANMLEAQAVVSFAEELVNLKLPEARRALAEQINGSADDWAQALSKQALDAVPDAGKKLEDYVVGQVDETLSQAVLIEDQQFREFVGSKHDMLQQAFDDLAKDTQLSDETLKTIGIALEEKLQADMDVQAKDLFSALFNLNAKLAHLRDGKHLTQEEALERRVLMLAIRIKLNEQATSSDSAQNDTASMPVCR